jgi:hypothetical protein
LAVRIFPTFQPGQGVAVHFAERGKAANEFKDFDDTVLHILFGALKVGVGIRQDHRYVPNVIAVPV